MKRPSVYPHKPNNNHNNNNQRGRKNKQSFVRVLKKKKNAGNADG